MCSGTSSVIDRQIMSVRRRSPRRRATQRLLVGLAFASPWLIGLLVFHIYPIFASLYYSLTNYNLSQQPDWVGFSNYVELFTRDATVPLAVKNTLVYALMFIPIGVVVAVILALLLNVKGLKGRTAYRSLYYLPSLVPAVASGMLWRWVLDPQWGLLNSILNRIGIRGPGWLGSPAWSKPSLVLIGLWGIGNMVVIYLAGLQDVNRDLYDAADVDGANGLQKIRYVTLPMISSVIFFNVIMSFIGTFQTFTLPFAITQGDGRPGQSLMFYAMYIYRQGFQYLNMGKASALAWGLLVVVLACTLVVLRSARLWVYYAGEDSGR